MITLRLPNGTCKDCVLSDLFASMNFKTNPDYTGGILFINYFLHFGNAYFQYSMVTLMSLNRTTSIFFYFVNEKIWSVLFPMSLGIIVFCAVYFTRTILLSSPYFSYNESLDLYSIKADSDILSAYSNVINFMAFSVISSVVLNTLSVIKLKLMTQNLATIERNLLFSTIASSVIQCAAAGNTFLLQLDQSRSTMLGQIGQTLLPFFSDFLTISQPYILIFLSSKVRIEMIRMYFKKNSKINSLVKSQALQVGGV
ncbi:hypothetical protein CAEBREN_06853 [Caenorhabditis brenneri]|uniref:Serpentine receptor class gamma n=1 Tax=Caenorhabditis brenneri TaxID=135651 RepID=G0MZS6_CAEBE|nr:hypothetical protein CAEBREN_06853 [Caenorhabditis brenneri]